MTTPANLKRVIRDWWCEHLEGKEEIDLDALTDAAMNELMDDPGFVEAVVDFLIRDIVRETGARVVNTLRPDMQPTNGHRHVTRAVLIAEVEQELATNGTGPLSIFRDHDRLGRTRNLLDMTREQLVTAAVDHYDTGRDRLRRAGLYKLLAQDMDHGQRVGEVWTEQQIAQTWAEVDIKFGYRRVESLAAGKDR